MSLATIEKPHAAFAKLDADTMAGCCAQDARLDDEAFSLSGRREIGMWRMLCDAVKAWPEARAAWRMETSRITATSAHREPHYRFSATGRQVHNVIDAEFTFDSHGLIHTHRDRFDFRRWSRQALGPPGLLLGRSPMLRNKVRNTAAANLERYLERA
jgi:hypothetical protein